MIQRIQSIFLLLSSAAFWSEFALPFATSDISNPGVLNDMVYNIQDSGILMGLTILGGAITLIAIFMFKNRSLQGRLASLGIVMSILLPLVAFLLIYNEGTTEVEGITIDDGFGLWLPLLSLIFAALASRFIKKDDKLVKSMDRLR